MGLWVEIRRVEPKGAALLRMLVILLALLQLSGWALLLSGVLGGWPPRPPGGGGIYTHAAQSLVSSAIRPSVPPPADPPSLLPIQQHLPRVAAPQRRTDDALVLQSLQGTNAPICSLGKWILSALEATI